MHRTFKVLSLFIAVSTALLTLSACNTVAGVGKDVSKAGEAVEKAAERAKK